ncbi:MAG: redoxin domain-containing protein [Planctomycetota bacterium]
MKRYMSSIVIVLAVPVMAYIAFGQGLAPGGERGAGQTEQRQNMRERLRNMSEEEREKFRAEMRDRAIFRPGGMGREEQLKAIAAIEDELAKLKAAVNDMPDVQSRFQDLSEEDRAKLREKMAGAVRDRQMAIRAIEQQLAKLEAPGRLQSESRARISELKEIHDLAVKEEATQTANRLQKLIAAYLGESRSAEGRIGAEPGADAARPPRERPARPLRDAGRTDSGRKAPAFTLQSFDGKPVSLSDYKGKTVVLEWFNFECPFSLYHHETANTMGDLAAKHKSKGVVWLAVNSTSSTTPQANHEFARKHKLTYPVLDDRSGKVGRAYGAKTTPHMFIINTNGDIVYDGAIDNSPMGKAPAGQKLVNYVDKALAELNAGGKVSTPNTKSYGCSVKYPN